MTTNEVVLKNNLISLEYNDIRFGLYDSDGEYIDYLFFTEEEENPIQLQEEYIGIVKDMDENQLTDWIKNIFDISELHHDCSPKDIVRLRKKHGEEWVNRVGNTAVIIREM